MKIGWNKFWTEIDFSHLKKWLTSRDWTKNNPYINYDPIYSAGFYSLNIESELLRSSAHQFSTPYQLVFDYRAASAESSWGSAIIDGDYTFPLQLNSHKTTAVNMFEEKGWLKKKNNPAPRVKRYCKHDGLPEITIEQATYYDQVGTNLTIDLPFTHPLTIETTNVKTIREWDTVQAKQNHILPNFENSLLANTIGVAIAITTVDRVGHKHLIKRFRREDVAVYRNMWHLPFSFALYFDRNIHNKNEIDIKDLINFDLPNEFAEEMGLEMNDFRPIKPLAFCRDLARGGKPQFFLEMKSKLSFEELRKKAHDSTGEFKGNIQIFDFEPHHQISPELAASMILLR